MNTFKILEECKVCGSKELTEVIHLDPQHLSATFVKDNETVDVAKIKVPLTLVLCDVSKNSSNCGLLQLKEEVDPDLLYRQYFYRSAASDTMRNDLKNVIADISSRLPLKKGDIVVDIGANDCTTINFYAPDLTRVGIEPAKNINWSHVDPSITILNDYFSKDVFTKKFETQKAQAIGCNAMFYDVSNPNKFVQDVRDILDTDGLWCVQLSYLPLMFDNVNFYDICHEHLAYYSLKTLMTLMKRNGLEIVDASTNQVNGGSIRIFVSHEGSKKHGTEAGRKNLESFLQIEKKMNLEGTQIYKDYGTTIQELGDKVRNYVVAELKKNNKVMGLGASTKGNVLLQFFGLTKAMMPYISERNPDKVGLRTLGTDFELISEEAARKMNPSCMLVLPWYFKDEIVKREKKYIDDGGTLLIPMPYAHIVTKTGEQRL